jgi:hypothetical protein
MGNSIIALLQGLSTMLSTQPALLVLFLLLCGIGYLMIRGSKGLSQILEKHLEKLSVQIAGMGKDMKIISLDLARLSASFEVHVVKTETRIDQLEKRVERLEKIHLKDQD